MVPQKWGIAPSVRLHAQWQLGQTHFLQGRDQHRALKLASKVQYHIRGGFSIELPTKRV